VDASIITADANRFKRGRGDHSFFGYSTNYLVDLENAVIVDVEATAPIRQAEVGAALNMLDRVEEIYGLYSESFVGPSRDLAKQDPVGQRMAPTEMQKQLVSRGLPFRC